MPSETIRYCTPRPCCERPQPWTNYGHWPLPPTNEHGVCQTCASIVACCTCGCGRVWPLTGQGLLALRRYLPGQYTELVAEQRAIRRVVATVTLPPQRLAAFQLRPCRSDRGWTGGQDARLQEEGPEQKATEGTEEEAGEVAESPDSRHGRAPQFLRSLRSLLFRFLFGFPRLATLTTGVGSSAAEAAEAPDPRTTDARAAARRTAV